MKKETKREIKKEASVIMVCALLRISFIELVQFSLSRAKTLIGKRGILNKMQGIAFIAIGVFHTLIIGEFWRTSIKSVDKILTAFIDKDEKKEEDSEAEPAAE